MNAAMVKRLILKDWYFQRWTIAAYLGAGAIALLMVARGGEAGFTAGSILLITALIAMGIHLTMATIVQERSDQTLSFVMSLPISTGEYTTAKILANVLIFLVPWLALLLGSFALILGIPAIPRGLLPFTALILTQVLVDYCLILAVALVSESQAWTIGALVCGNLLIQAFMYYVSHIPGIRADMTGPRIVWSPAALRLLLTQAGVVAAALGLTFHFQSRKTDFI